MKSTIKVMTVVGARPNLMKAAPLAHAIEKYNDFGNYSTSIAHTVVHTGQHYDKNMSDSFFETLGIRAPDFYLGVGSGSHGHQIGRTMIEFEKVLLEQNPDWLVLLGDVNATAACSIIAKKYLFKVAHIEAGLRSNDWSMPEEINRIVTDRISDLLFTPCRFADANLEAEGIPRERIRRVGNIMIDTLEANREKAGRMDVTEVIARNLVEHGEGGGPVNPPVLSGRDFVLLTMHRPSNVDRADVLKSLLEVIVRISRRYPLIFPVHPRTRGKISEFGLWSAISGEESLIITQPLGYLEFLCLNMYARVMMTDSGGLQEEACMLGTPCLILRDNTERPVTLVENGGTNRLVSNEPEKVIEGFEWAVEFPREERRPELWDGHTAERIVESLVEASFL